MPTLRMSRSTRMPNTPCLEPSCPAFATYRGRCFRHARQRDAEIQRQGKRIYNSKRWRILRRKKLSQDPLCNRCGKVADVVHHVRGVELDPWGMANLESLCAGCHNAETRAQQTGGRVAP